MGIILLPAFALHVALFAGLPIVAWRYGMKKLPPSQRSFPFHRSVACTLVAFAACFVSFYARNAEAFFAYTRAGRLYGFTVLLDTMYNVPNLAVLGITAALLCISRLRSHALANAALTGAGASLLLQPLWAFEISSILDRYGVEWTH